MTVFNQVRYVFFRKKKITRISTHSKLIVILLTFANILNAGQKPYTNDQQQIGPLLWIQGIR